MYTKDRENAEITISALHCASYREESKKQQDLLPAQSHSTLLKTGKCQVDDHHQNGPKWLAGLQYRALWERALVEPMSQQLHAGD